MAIADGRRIAVRFTQPLVGNVLGLDPPAGYKKGKIDMAGAIASALNEYSTSYPASKAIDGDAATYWRGTTAVNWLQVQLPEARVATQIRLYLSSYYIKTFTFSGSNDGVEWVQIGDEYTAASSTTAQWYTFEIANSDAYLYYRIDTLTAYNTSRIYIYELELYEDVPVGNETKFTVSFDEYNHVPGGVTARSTRPVSRLEHYISVDTKLDLSSGSYAGIEHSSGSLSLVKDVEPNNTTIFAALSDLLNTTAGMTVLRDNTGQDDGVDTVSGVDWFTFNGAAVTNLYVGGNSFVGFGENAEHLKVCRRNGKMWYLYRQEGLIGSTKFLKIRWEGYTRYNYTSSTYALTWELFMFDDGGLFLNLVTVPTSSSYLGTSSLTCGSNTYTYSVTTSTPVAYAFLPQDDGSFVVTAGEYPVVVNLVPYGQCEFATDVIQSITAVKESYISWTSVLPEGTGIKVSAALSEGEYVECEKDGSISCISVGDDLSTETLRVKVEMSTDDLFLAPTLQDLVIQIFDVLDQNVIVLAFDSGTPNSVQRAAGDITVAYDGSGTLMGHGGPVLAFEQTFTPIGLDPKNNPHDGEHIDISSVQAISHLMRVEYADHKSSDEHIDITDVVAIGTLIAVDDI